MGLKRAIYVDNEGRKKMVLLPEDASEEEAERGIPLGPPSLEELELPHELEIRLNNELFSREIFSPIDAVRRRADIMSAIQSALKVDVGKIVELYLGKDYRYAHQEQDPVEEKNISTQKVDRNMRRARK